MRSRAATFVARVVVLRGSADASGMSSLNATLGAAASSDAIARLRRFLIGRRGLEDSLDPIAPSQEMLAPCAPMRSYDVLREVSF